MEQSVLGTKSFNFQYDSLQIGNKTNLFGNEIWCFVNKNFGFIAGLKRIILQMKIFCSQNGWLHFKKRNWLPFPKWNVLQIFLISVHAFFTQTRQKFERVIIYYCLKCRKSPQNLNMFWIYVLSYHCIIHKFYRMRQKLSILSLPFSIKCSLLPPNLDTFARCVNVTLNA